MEMIMMAMMVLTNTFKEVDNNARFYSVNNRKAERLFETKEHSFI